MSLYCAAAREPGAQFQALWILFGRKKENVVLASATSPFAPFGRMPEKHPSGTYLQRNRDRERERDYTCIVKETLQKTMYKQQQTSGEWARET